MLALLVVAASARPQPRRVAQATVFLDYAAVGALRTTLLFSSKELAPSHTPLLLGLLESAFGAGQIGGALVVGRLSDDFGRRALLLLCLCCSCVSYACAGAALFARSALLLLLSRLPAGISKQTTTTCRAIVCDSATPAQRSSELSMLYACSALGYAAGPLAGGALTERHGAVATTIVAAASFAVAAPVVVGALDETRPAPTASKGARWSVWRRPELRAALLRFALPEAALVMHTVVAQPLLAQHLGLSPMELGRLSSVQGLAAAFFSTAWLPPLLGRGWLTEATAQLAACALVLVPSAYLAWRPSMAAVWLCLPPLALAVSLQRAVSPSVVSRAAPPDAQGEALGALDAVSSLCRVVVPVCAGALATSHGAAAPYAAQAAIAGVAALLFLVS